MTVSMVVLNLFIFTAAGHRLPMKNELDVHADAVIVIPYDEDDYSEFLLKREYRYYVTDQKSVTHFQINMPDEDHHFLKCLDIDATPPKELLFQNKINDTIWVSIYSGTTLRHRFRTIHGTDIRTPEGWDGWLNGVYVIDANDDGRQDLLFMAATCFDLNPRLLFAYDIGAGREIWSFPMGAFPRQTHLVDLDDDGHDEIIVSTTAVNNGCDVNGYTDAESYVMALDRAGRLLWSRRIGGVYSDVISWVGDIDGAGGLDVVAVDCEGPARIEEPNRILILDAASGAVRKYIRSGERYIGMCVADINRDERYEVIVGNTDGIVRVYDASLDLLLERDFGTHVKVLDVTDLNGDGANELLMMLSDNRLLATDEYLEPVYEYALTAAYQTLVSVRHGRQTKILISSADKPTTFSLLAFGGPGLLSAAARQRSPIELLLVALLLAATGYLVLRNRRLGREVKQKAAYTDQILEWSGLAQRLAHEIKNPLSTINLTLQRVQEICENKYGADARSLNKYTDSIHEEIERVRDTVDKFMKILAAEKATFQPNDINRVIEAVMRKYESNLPEAVKIKKHLAKDMPLVHCDENQISTVLSNVIENALEAMASKGTLTLRTACTEKVLQNKIVEYVETRIEDTGSGMSREQQKNLFKPFQSTKTGGTGLGLVISRKIVEGHGGTINLTSRPSVGTVVTINIPTARAKPDKGGA